MLLENMDTKIISTDIGLFQITLKNNIIYESKPVNSKRKSDCKIPDYFQQKLKFKLYGTEFQKLVWKEILKIPYGETRTYSQIAESIGRPSSVRAVANACGQNKLAIIVPCHRVVGKNGIGGYKWGIELKEWLIAHEKKLK